MRSQIIKASGEPVVVDYMMRRNGESWLISDIYLDGAISEVATRRSEFSAILKNEGIDGLIAALNRKADVLTGQWLRRSSVSAQIATLGRGDLRWHRSRRMTVNGRPMRLGLIGFIRETATAPSKRRQIHRDSPDASATAAGGCG